MRSLLAAIYRFFRRLFRAEQGSSGKKKQPLFTSAGVSPALRQLIYQALYELPQRKRTHAAQMGALLRKKDPDFSYEKYHFTKLIDLLEALPELVDIERIEPEPGNPNGAPVYYIRPVHDIRGLLTGALKAYDSPDGWVHIESLWEAIASRAPQVSPQRYGFRDKASFLASRVDLIEFKADAPDYLRLRKATRRSRQSPMRRSGAPAVSPSSHSNGKNAVRLALASPRSGPPIQPLGKFAGLSTEDLNDKVGELAAMALPENWYFGPQPPEDFAYPILKSYLRYTFVRLQYEGKTITSPNQHYLAFNTGLLDRLLRPIYALLTQLGDSNQPWQIDFCLAGEGTVGKTLVAQFAHLPVAANYFENADQAFYYLEAGAPEVDWQHVVQDNMARLPVEFLRAYAPAGFQPRSTKGLSTADFFAYKQAFIEALEADPATYRQIISHLEAALERTLKRIQINYKTAVPTYYPKINSIDLLLPLCLVDEHTADVALVVRRSPSGKYIGHTILTLRQAYNNARLICKLDEDWLVRSMILSQEEADDEAGEAAAARDNPEQSSLPKLTQSWAPD